MFEMLPMPLHRAPGGGQISRDKLTALFETFRVESGTFCWKQTQIAIPGAAESRNRRRRKQVDENEQRAFRAKSLIEV